MRKQLDRLRDPPRAGADDGRVTHGGDGQAQFQTWLRFEHLRWENGRPETAACVCESCEAPDWQRLVERREDYPIGMAPLGGLLLVSGGDVQKDRIEAYLNQGPGWNGYLLENHIAGQRSIQLFQREGAELPAIGKTLYLVANEGLANEYSQYVRLTRVQSESRTFGYNTGNGVVDFAAVVVTCDLSDALRYDFPGSAPSRLFTMEVGKTKTRDTVVADAAKYCGVVRVRFGAWVTATGNEGQIWYDPAAVVNGQIFKPVPVSPATTAATVTMKVAPLGFDIAFTETNKRAYRSPNPLSKRLLLPGRRDQSAEGRWCDDPHRAHQKAEFLR